MRAADARAHPSGRERAWRGRRPLARWLSALVASLGEMARATARGRQRGRPAARPVDRLGGTRRMTLDVSFADWRRWLARQLGGNVPRPRNRQPGGSPVFHDAAASSTRCWCCSMRAPAGRGRSRCSTVGVRAELALPTAERMRDGAQPTALDRPARDGRRDVAAHVGGEHNCSRRSWSARGGAPVCLRQPLGDDALAGSLEGQWARRVRPWRSG
jgi:hypothetical protein